jgi:long-chain acyl-CoA synthetase
MSRPMPRVHASVVAMLEDTVAQFGDRAALVQGEQSLSYRELRRCVAGLAQQIRLHARPGERVATVLGNSFVAALAPYAIAAAGAVHVPLNPLYTARELGFMLGDAEPAVVLADDALLPTVQPLVRDLPDCELIAASQVGCELAGWAANAALDAMKPAPVDGSDLALLQYTGGSTGRPKGVQLTHRAVNSNIAQREALLPVARGCENVLCVMPLFHSYAMAMGLYLSAYSGSTLVILPAYHPERVLEAVQRYGISIFPGSPTLFVGLMTCARFASTDWSRVHTCYSGSAALPAETLERWERATASRVYEGYGQTEAGPVLSFNPAQGVAKIASVGVAVPDTELQVVDVESGTSVLPAGQCGEVRARGPQIMTGYWKLPEETRESLRDGWLYTGDIGELDAQGYLFIRDRKKDLVIVGGYNVYPREIEEVLYTHPDVREAAVVGQPDSYRGETLRAFVALKPGSGVVAQELLDYCRAQLAKYKVPAAVEILPELPKTSVNKIDKKPLKQRVHGSS